MKKAKQANNAKHTTHATQAAKTSPAHDTSHVSPAQNATTAQTVVLALLGVACSVAPYFVVAQIVYALMIIFLDEATANIDPENENELMHALRQLTAEKTVIMIAHHLKTVQHADQILVVDHGRIVQQGTHAELMQQDGLYRRLISERNVAVNWAINK